MAVDLAGSAGGKRGARTTRPSWARFWILGSNQQPVAIDRARIDRQIRELALEHAAGGLGDDTYLTRLKTLREARDAITERTATGVPGQRAVEWLRALRE